ncbi:hypothetical protein DV495_004113 [Geotrichum candidum]|nr:hypothetical protein DV452_000565 [Geotrichum candidum]KAF5122920.1 hypothetical protein DV495_004113 [Geotrichum candidum]KAF7499369.1 hypothetical protein DV113_002644 [Geotrichum candidum]KAI8135040.1 hypothetical protein DUD61_001269 [Geotrichum candidum]KAI9211080.1 hypothetical protein DS838_004061 [Geotrichum bryndzae]
MGLADTGLKTIKGAEISHLVLELLKPPLGILLSSFCLGDKRSHQGPTFGFEGLEITQGSGKIVELLFQPELRVGYFGCEGGGDAGFEIADPGMHCNLTSEQVLYG